MREKSLKIINDLETDANEDAIYNAIEFIDYIVEEYYDLKEELQQRNDEFSQYKVYGRCYDI